MDVDVLNRKRQFGWFYERLLSKMTPRLRMSGRETECFFVFLVRDFGQMMILFRLSV